jgi:hypothetical protein
VKEVDFKPFRGDSSVSVYEFFGRFEAWSRGMLSSDSKAYVLYTRHLDTSVVHGNKELEKRRESYPEMKSWLINKYGRPAHVADLYLRNIQKLSKPAANADPHTEASYLKAVYGNIVTLTELKEERGVGIQKLESHIYNNDFLSKLADALPAGVRDKFIDNLGEEDYSLIEGKRYMDDIIRLLRKAYMKAEITASATGCPAPGLAPPKQRTAKAVNYMSTRVPGSSGTSTASDSDGAKVSPQPKKKQKKPKSEKAAGVTVVTTAASAGHQAPSTAAPTSRVRAPPNNLNTVLSQFAPPIR